ncbi:YceI family protein [Aureispira]|nr:YceI family protein [Aureispira sp.]
MKSLLILVFSFSIFNAFAQQENEWKIDMMHSYVGFDVNYMEIIPFHGKFTQLEGVVLAKELDFSDMKINAKIPANSIYTGSDKREKHLRSSDFFDMDNHPYITFKSTEVSKVTDQKEEHLKLVGDLTIRGITKSIELYGNFNSEPVNDPWGHIKTGCSFRGTINRQDFEITYGQVLDSGALAIDNEVNIILDVVLMRDR